MKAILIAALAELLLFACVSVLLRSDVTRRRPISILIAFLALLPVLPAAYLLISSDLGFLPANLVMPIAWIDIAQLREEFASRRLGGERLATIATNGFLRDRGDGYALSPKGRLTATVFSWIKRLWRLGAGG